MNSHVLSISEQTHQIINKEKIFITITVNNKTGRIYPPNYNDEVLKDIDSYLKFVSPIDIYQILLNKTINTPEEAINAVVKDFNTDYVEVKCSLPKRVNQFISTEEENIQQLKKTLKRYLIVAGILSLILMVITTIAKTLH